MGQASFRFPDFTFLNNDLAWWNQTAMQYFLNDANVVWHHGAMKDLKWIFQ